jgi:hypothetical protein
MKNGPYELVKAPDEYPGMRYRGRYCYEHHLVYWKKHGVLPEQGQVIHHINGKRRDNCPENLELLEVGEHNAGHSHARRGPLKHGTLNAYRHRYCRCALCRRANADATAERRKRTGRR